MTRFATSRRRLAGLLWCLWLLIPAAASAQDFVDAAGRTVAVPDAVHRVLPAGPPADLLLYSLAPDLLVGMVEPWGAAEAAYVPEAYRKLAEVPRINRNISAADLDRLKALKPDLIVDYGDVTPAYAGIADKLQAATGIPYILLDGKLAATPVSVRGLGRLLGRGERAEEVARCAEAMLARVAAALAGLPSADRVPIFFARGDDGLQAVRPGNVNGEIPDDAGGRSVVPAGKGTFVKMTTTEVGALAPKVVLLDKADAAAAGTPLQAGLPATTRFLVDPGRPIAWLDDPPSLNRLVGVVWLAGQLYPERLHVDASDLQGYWKTLFGIEISPAAVNEALQEAHAGG
jgi:iron complex transport system substrate-binding protein